MCRGFSRYLTFQRCFYSFILSFAVAIVFFNTLCWNRIRYSQIVHNIYFSESLSSPWYAIKYWIDGCNANNNNNETWFDSSIVSVTIISRTRSMLQCCMFSIWIVVPYMPIQGVKSVIYAMKNTFNYKAKWAEFMWLGNNNTELFSLFCGLLNSRRKLKISLIVSFISCALL